GFEPRSPVQGRRRSGRARLYRGRGTAARHAEVPSPARWHRRRRDACDAPLLLPGQRPRPLAGRRVAAPRPIGGQMFIDLTIEQRKLRDELRSYFADLVTP